MHNIALSDHPRRPPVYGDHAKRTTLTLPPSLVAAYREAARLAAAAELAGGAPSARPMPLSAFVSEMLAARDLAAIVEQVAARARRRQVRVDNEYLATINAWRDGRDQDQESEGEDGDVDVAGVTARDEGSAWSNTNATAGL